VVEQKISQNPKARIVALHNQRRCGDIPQRGPVDDLNASGKRQGVNSSGSESKRTDLHELGSLFKCETWQNRYVKRGPGNIMNPGGNDDFASPSKVGHDSRPVAIEEKWPVNFEMGALFNMELRNRARGKSASLDNSRGCGKAK
jgi:hypothetical protein